MKRAIATTLLLILFSSPICLFAKEKKKINDVYGIILILDGLKYETFEKIVDKGLAPNIKKYFIDEGAYFSHATTVFPSASNLAYQSFVSGLFPGHAGIPYLNRFDRTNQEVVEYFTIKGQQQLNEDFLNFKALSNHEIKELHHPSSIFDQLQGYETTAIYSSFNTNVKHRRPSSPIRPFWSMYASGSEEMLDKYAFSDIMHFYDRDISLIPRFSLVGLYSADVHGHHYGAESPILDYTVEEVDQFIGKFINLLKKKGIFDKTYIILASDHGMHSINRKKFGLKKFIKKLGLKVHNGHPRKNNFDVFVGVRGIATANLYVRSRNGWQTSPTIEEMRNIQTKKGKVDLIKKLTESEKVKFLAVRNGPNSTKIFSKYGEGSIDWFTGNNENWYRYIVEGNANDPLQIKDSEAKRLLNGKYYSADLWGELTKSHPYPDCVVQLSQIFTDGRSGDIYIIPEDKWSFFRNKQGTHGSIIKEDMHIFFMLRGPKIPIGKYSFARTADLYPTILDWFGLNEEKKNIDGRHLFKYRTQSNQINRVARSKKPKKSGEKELLVKLKNISNKLAQQKNESSTIQYTPAYVLDSNIWLVNRLVKGISKDAKTVLQ